MQTQSSKNGSLIKILLEHTYPSSGLKIDSFFLSSVCCNVLCVPGNITKAIKATSTHSSASKLEGQICSPTHCSKFFQNIWEKPKSTGSDFGFRMLFKLESQNKLNKAKIRNNHGAATTTSYYFSVNNQSGLLRNSFSEHK